MKMMKTPEKKRKRPLFFNPDASKYSTTIRQTIALSLCALMLLSTTAQVFAQKGNRHSSKKKTEETPISKVVDKTRANETERSKKTPARNGGKLSQQEQEQNTPERPSGPP